MKQRTKYVCFAGVLLALAVISGANIVDASDLDGVAAAPHGCSELVFADEFDSDGLPDSTRWFFERGYVRNGELQCYTPSNSRCKGGVLIIEACDDSIYVDGRLCAVTSASLSSRLPAPWRYGYVEVRARLPEGGGANPAVVLMPSESAYGSWPRSGEIRLMEQNGSAPGRIQFCSHSERYNHIRGTERSYAISVSDSHSAFHTYALLWSPDRLTWYFDGKEVYSLERRPDSDWTVWPFDQDFYLNINLSVGGWRSAGDMAELPQRFEIDYVRIYR